MESHALSNYHHLGLRSNVSIADRTRQCVQRLHHAELPDQSSFGSCRQRRKSHCLRHFGRQHCQPATCEHDHATGSRRNCRAFQCDVSNNHNKWRHEFGPTTTAAKRLGALAGLFSSRSGKTGDSGSSGSSLNRAARGIFAAFLLAVIFFLSVWLIRPTRLPRMVPVLAFTFAVAISATVGGCGQTDSTAAVIPYTPTGTYSLTVHGFVQNAARGFTMTLVVDN